MIAHLKAYEAYKDSGQQWIGDVPDHWNVLPAFGVYSPILELNQDMREKTVLSLSYGRIIIKSPEKLHGLVPESFETYQIVNPGDLVLRTTDLQNDHSSLRVGIVRNRGIITSAYLALRAKAGISPSFAYEFLNAWDISKAIYGYGSGLRQNLDFVHFKRMPVALPPISEQTAIVRFLDYYDRRIGRYIRAKQRMIKLLEEQKQAIIHEYVNGKINPFTGKPYPRYKPSGVEWLGDFPEHWEMRRNGMLFTQRNEVGFGNLPILEVSLRTGTRIREFENSHRKQVLTDREKYKRAAAGDIAYNMMRMWQGAVGVAPIDGLISPAYVVAKPLPGTASRYFSHLFRTPAYMNEIDKYSRGIVKDRNRLYWEDFKRIRSCYPPFEEQLAIADTVVQMTEKIGAAAYRVHHQISLFREFRTRLVADVVTGKVDVREAAARLPEEGAETEPIEESDALSEMDEDAADQLDDKCEETETV